MQFTLELRLDVIVRYIAFLDNTFFSRLIKVVSWVHQEGVTLIEISHTSAASFKGKGYLKFQPIG